MSPIDPDQRQRGAVPRHERRSRRGDRRGDRDPHREPQQVRVRPRAARDPAGPPPLHRHHLSGGLRLRPRHPGRRRRPARRARAGRRPDLPRLRGAGAHPRHVLHARREGRRRQADLRARARPPVGRRPRHRGRARAPAQRDRALLQHLQGPRAREVGRGAGLRRPGRSPRPSSRQCRIAYRCESTGTRQHRGRDDTCRFRARRSERPSSATTSCVGASTRGSSPTPSASLADFYTEDAVYIDGAWGRIEGSEAIAHWLVDSMLGMEDWKFPIEFTAIEGNDIVVKWTQIMPRHEARRDAVPPVRRTRGSVYAGDGKFSYEEDAYNMAHVLEDIEASGWQPPDGTMNVPPAHPDRNFDIPARGAARSARASLRSTPEFPKPGNPPPPNGLVVEPVRFPVDCCCWACGLAPERRRRRPLAVADVVGDGDGLPGLGVLDHLLQVLRRRDGGAVDVDDDVALHEAGLGRRRPGDDAEDHRARGRREPVLLAQRRASGW